MRIGINAQSLTSSHVCGINIYLTNLLKHLSKIDKKNRYLLFSSKEIKMKPTHELFETRKAKDLPFFSHWQFSRVCQANLCDLAFIPKETVPFFLKTPSVITVYDLFFLKFYKQFKSQIAPSVKLHYEMAKWISFKKADKILCISHDCKNDLIQEFGIDPGKIAVTYLGYDAQIFYPRSQDEIEEVKTKYQISNPYFINISSVFWERKNLLGLLKAFHLFQKFNDLHEMVIVGNPGPSLPLMEKYIKEKNLKVKCLFSIPSSDIAKLLTGAQGLVFPSFHEGFGLPIIEAMACGCPVITSNCFATKEVSGDAAFLVNPHNIEEICLGMQKIVENMSLVENLRVKGFIRKAHFSWEKTAQDTLNALKCFAK